MNADAAPKPASAFWRTVKKIDKNKINNRWMALRNALAVALPLGVGIALGTPLGAVAVATGALNVSFSDGRDPYYQRARRMITWSVLGAIAVFIGSISGNHSNVSIVVMACWGFLAGMMLAVGTHAGDLGLNTLVALIVFAGKGSTTWRGAVDTGLLVLSGGLLQSSFCLAFWPVRRTDPERRAIGHVYLDLAREVDPNSDLTAAPIKARGADEQDTIDALGHSHTVEGERYRLLFDQADRLRLSVYALMRLREQLGEHDDQRSEAESDAAGLLDAVLQLAAKLMNAAGTQLIEGAQPLADAPGSETLRHLINEAQQQKKAAQFPLAASIASAIDVLAGQLRLVGELVHSAELADTLKRDSQRTSPDLKKQLSNWVAALQANLDFRSSVFRHAIRMSLCIAAGDWLEHRLGWQRAYWLPMTVAVVLKPDFGSTFSRGILRLLGTFVGLVLATVLIHVLPISAITQLLLVGLFTFCLRYWGPANYGLFTWAVSGLVVFLIAATGSPPVPVMAARALNTGAGGLLAILAYALWPTWETAQVSESFADMIDASRKYLQKVFSGFGAELNTEISLGRERLEWQRTRTSVEASVDRVITEPGITAAKSETLLSMLASSHALMLAMIGLEAGMSHRHTRTPPAALETFGRDVDFTLYFLAAALRGSKPASHSLPELREDHRRLLESRESFSPDDDFILAETDRLTVSLNTLREQVMRYVNGAAPAHQRPA